LCPLACFFDPGDLQVSAATEKETASIDNYNHNDLPTMLTGPRRLINLFATFPNSPKINNSSSSQEVLIEAAFFEITADLPQDIYIAHFSPTNNLLTLITIFRKRDLHNHGSPRFGSEDLDTSGIGSDAD
jgi:hypothetical protein